MANQSYLEMYNVAESKVQYLDGQLQHAPVYLKHDEQKEMDEKAVHEEAERQIKA